MTDTIVYVGPANYSEESASNTEFGFISTDKDFIDYIKLEILPDMQASAIPYYQYDFTALLLEASVALSAVYNAKNELYEEVYRLHDDIDGEWYYYVEHEALVILVHKVIKDPDTESLIRRFLQGGVLVEGIYEEIRVGTAQGSPISPLLANIYLNEFDKELTARGLHFVRYVDDCIICVKSEMAANRVMKSITKWLLEHLRVEVNATKTKVSRPNGIKLLGFSFYQKGERWRPKPHIKSVKALEYKLKPLLKRNWGVSMEIRMKKINEVTKGWDGSTTIG